MDKYYQKFKCIYLNINMTCSSNILIKGIKCHLQGVGAQDLDRWYNRNDAERSTKHLTSN